MYLTTLPLPLPSRHIHRVRNLALTLAREEVKPSSFLRVSTPCCLPLRTHMASSSHPRAPHADPSDVLACNPPTVTQGLTADKLEVVQLAALLHDLYAARPTPRHLRWSLGLARTPSRMGAFAGLCPPRRTPRRASALQLNGFYT